MVETVFWASQALLIYKQSDITKMLSHTSVQLVDPIDVLKSEKIFVSQTKKARILQNKLEDELLIPIET